MNTVNNRLKCIIDELFDGNVSAFSRATNISQSTLKDIVGGKMNKPSCGVLEKIASVKTLNVSMEWLLTGEGEMYVPATPSESTNADDSSTIERLISIIESQQRTIENLLNR